MRKLLLSLTIGAVGYTSQLFAATSFAEERDNIRTSLPALNTSVLSYVCPEIPGDRPTATRLGEIDVQQADIYGVVAAELAYQAPKYPEIFCRNAVLTAENLVASGVPSILAGWKVTHVLNTICPEDKENGWLDPEHTDLFGMTLQSPAGFKISCVRGTDPKSLKNLLADVGVLTNLGDMEKAMADIQQHFKTVTDMRYGLVALGVRSGARLISSPVELGELANSILLGVKGLFNAYGNPLVSEASDSLKRWFVFIVREVDAFLRESEPDMVAGHSLGGILANGVVRAREAMDPESAATKMAKSIQYILSYNATGTNKLIPAIIEALKGEDLPSAAEREKDYSLTGVDMRRYREFYRKKDVVGQFGGHIGKSIKLDEYLACALSPVVLASATGAAEERELTVADATVSVPTIDSSVAAASVATVGPVLGDMISSKESIDALSLVSINVASSTGDLRDGTGSTGTSSGIRDWGSKLASAVGTASTAIVSGFGSALSTAASAVASVPQGLTEYAKKEAQGILNDHACSPMMRELMMAYLFQHQREIAAARATLE